LLFQAVIFGFSIRGFFLARELRRFNLFLKGAICHTYHNQYRIIFSIAAAD
jgi:hypothetical protein